jgi:anaerobic ribonucleoside-triphosphate reductase
MKTCFICGKKLGEKEGFGSGVTKDCKRAESAEEEVVACSQNCINAFENKFLHKGKPIDHYSRITGYVQKVSGWNKGKQQEFLDRKRYNLGHESL